MPCRRRKPLENALEPSSRAAWRCGPKQARPAALNASTTPATSGASGPTMVSSTCSRLASSTSPGISPTETAALRTRGSACVPALPGATMTSLTRGDWAHFQARACSRPPPPTMRTFMPTRPPSMPEVAHAGDRHGHAVFVGGCDHLLVAHRAARMNHRGDAEGGGDVDAVAKRKEGIGCHDCPAHFELLVRGLERGEARRVDATHLPGTDADRSAAAREHDGVRLDELHHGPGEQQVLELAPLGLAAADDAQLARIEAGDIALLQKEAAGHAAQLELIMQLIGGGLECADREHPQIGFGGQHRQRRRSDRWRGDDLGKLPLEDGARGWRIELAVEGDDAAEGGSRIGAVSAAVRLEQTGGLCDPTGVGMLD